MADEGQNILIPRPGFPLYTTLSAGLGIETREYNLLPNQDWEVDLLHMESLIDANTAAIVVNSPSNPCGSVFSPSHMKQILAIAEEYKVPIIADEIYDYFVFPGQTYVPIASLTTNVPVLSCGGLTKRFLVPGWRMGWIAIIVNSPSNPCGSVFSPAHLRQILDIAERHKVPIIADEIYDNFVFPGETYVPIASLTTTVPVLSCGGLTKRFLVPGWRMGWIVIYDRGHVFDHEVRKGLLCMSQRIIGSNTLVQGALPTILANTPKSFFDDTINVIQNN